MRGHRPRLSMRAQEYGASTRLSLEFELMRPLPPVLLRRLLTLVSRETRRTVDVVLSADAEGSPWCDMWVDFLLAVLPADMAVRLSTSGNGPARSGHE